MKLEQMKLCAGVAIAAVGMTVAWRSLQRSDAGVVVVNSGSDAEVESLLPQSDGSIVIATPESARRIGDDLRTIALASISLDKLPTAARDESSRVDLADAFRARVGGLFMEDFSASLEDMISRGWPRYSESLRDKQRLLWESGRLRMDGLRIDPAWIAVHSIDQQPQTLDGYGMSCSQTTPIDERSGRPLDRLSEPDEGIIEVRLRGHFRPTPDHPPVPAVICYQFTWDRSLAAWRWIQTCVLHRPDDPSFMALPPV